MQTQAVEDYLKTIFEIERERGSVGTTALAERLGVAPASVTGMIKKLAARKLVRYSPYEGVVLSKAGRMIALETIRPHRLLELYLTVSLGYGWDVAHDEAERLELVISEQFEERIFEALGRDANPGSPWRADPSPGWHGADIVQKSISDAYSVRAKAVESARPQGGLR